MPLTPLSIRLTGDPSDNVAIARREVHSYLTTEAAMNPYKRRSHLRIPWLPQQPDDIAYDLVAPIIIGFGIEVALKRIHRVLALQGKTKSFTYPVSDSCVNNRHKGYSHDLNMVFADLKSPFRGDLATRWHSRLARGDHRCRPADKIGCLETRLKVVSAFMKDRYYLEGNLVDLWTEERLESSQIPALGVLPGDKSLLKVLSGLCTEVAVPYYESQVVHINGVEARHRNLGRIEGCQSEEDFYSLRGSGNLCRVCEAWWLKETAPRQRYTGI